ncbi:hypothetical protein Tco_0374595 [Tanacetum coccineum]
MEAPKTQRGNLQSPGDPSTGVSSSTRASGSKPRSNTKHNRILPAKSVNNKKVEDHPRTNKSIWTKVNRVDSSISSKTLQFISNSESGVQNVQVDLQSKADEYGDVLKNKARIAKGYRQEEVLILKNRMLPVALIEAIRKFIANAYATGKLNHLPDGCQNCCFSDGDLQEEVFVISLKIETRNNPTYVNRNDLKKELFMAKAGTKGDV